MQACGYMRDEFWALMGVDPATAVEVRLEPLPTSVVCNKPTPESTVAVKACVPTRKPDGYLPFTVERLPEIVATVASRQAGRRPRLQAIEWALGKLLQNAAHHTPDELTAMKVEFGRLAEDAFTRELRERPVRPLREVADRWIERHLQWLVDGKRGSRPSFATPEDFTSKEKSKRVAAPPPVVVPAQPKLTKEQLREALLAAIASPARSEASTPAHAPREHTPEEKAAYHAKIAAAKAEKAKRRAAQKKAEAAQRRAKEAAAQAEEAARQKRAAEKAEADAAAAEKAARKNKKNRSQDAHA